MPFTDSFPFELTLIAYERARSESCVVLWTSGKGLHSCQSIPGEGGRHSCPFLTFLAGLTFRPLVSTSEAGGRAEGRSSPRRRALLALPRCRKRVQHRHDLHSPYLRRSEVAGLPTAAACRKCTPPAKGQARPMPLSSPRVNSPAQQGEACLRIGRSRPVSVTAGRFVSACPWLPALPAPQRPFPSEASEVSAASL